MSERKQTDCMVVIAMMMVLFTLDKLWCTLMFLPALLASSIHFICYNLYFIFLLFFYGKQVVSHNRLVPRKNCPVKMASVCPILPGVTAFLSVLTVRMKLVVLSVCYVFSFDFLFITSFTFYFFLYFFIFFFLGKSLIRIIEAYLGNH